MKLNLDNPGKYDALCTMVRKEADAEGAIIIVIGGNVGHGFSVQVAPAMLLTLPDLLEHVAGQIREQLKP